MSSTVLCVDDSPTIRELVKSSLSAEGIDVIPAENGLKALDMLNSEIDLFIVDINMPEMGGFDFVEKLKKLPRYNRKPVVFLTTESSAEKKARGKELGVSGWIVKPFQRETLLKIVTMLID